MGLLRLLALYSTDDEPSYERQLCLMRKNRSHLSFFIFFLRHAGILIQFPQKNGNLSLLFFLSSDISWPGTFILFFFPPTWKKCPCRDLSSVEYSAGSLIGRRLPLRSDLGSYKPRFRHCFMCSLSK